MSPRASSTGRGSTFIPALRMTAATAIAAAIRAELAQAGQIGCSFMFASSVVASASVRCASRVVATKILVDDL
jgi:hypothetical protein